jgi:hypothetical protein
VSRGVLSALPTGEPEAVEDGPQRRLSRRDAPGHPEGRSAAEEARSAFTGPRPGGYAGLWSAASAFPSQVPLPVRGNAKDPQPIANALAYPTHSVGEPRMVR